VAAISWAAVLVAAISRVAVLRMRPLRTTDSRTGFHTPASGITVFTIASVTLHSSAHPSLTPPTTPAGAEGGHRMDCNGSTSAAMITTSAGAYRSGAGRSGALL
jgi:hypothetical protein